MSASPVSASYDETADRIPSGTAGFDATGSAGLMPSWDELVREHADRVYRLAYRLSGNQHDAEDLTQETFIRVFRSLSNYKPGTFEGWLHRITTNLFLDMVRRRGKIRMEALPEDYDRVPADTPDPQQLYADANLDADGRSALVLALRNLKDQGAIVVLITHQPNAQLFVDRVYALKNGVLEAVDSEDTKHESVVHKLQRK